MPSSSSTPACLRWIGDVGGRLELLDQTLLPSRHEWIGCPDVESVVEAIKSLRVRGAPAIGIAGAYGLAVAAAEAGRRGLEPGLAREHLHARAAELDSARPTAVNLRWAVRRTVAAVERLPADAPTTALEAAVLTEARAIHAEDRELCAAIGRHGARALAEALAAAPGAGVLTHCNTGALATGGDGTALAAITTAWDDGHRFDVFADETRPLFQGARLTAWELVQRGIPVTVLVDSAAGQLMRTGRVAACIVGADRITASGDVANKIGTYSLAVLAAAHGIPFFVAAPSSTFDLSIDGGDAIPIEQRAATEVTHPLGMQAAPDGVLAYNPAFDVTPAALIRGIVTEHGLIQPVDRERIADVLRATL